MKTEKTIGYICVVCEGRGSLILYMDKDGKPWYGGSETLVKVPIFKSRKKAGYFSRKMRRAREKKGFEILWTHTVPVFIKKEGESDE